MGQDIEQERFGEVEFARFRTRLGQCVEVLGELVRRPGFGLGPATVGAELELFLVDGAGRPLPVNQKVLAEALDPRLTYELDRFQIECNATPVPVAGRPFGALGRELGEVVVAVDRAAQTHRGRAVAVGILPTFVPEDFGPGAMTDATRYRVLSSALRRRRREPFAVHIDGPEPLETSAEDVSLEGANSSLQVHLRVAPGRFAATYNAAQLAVGPVLAAAGNSPTFLGKRLWQETRIALFKQATDDRPGGARGRAAPARVGFGREWVRTGAPELFAALVERHAPALPMLSEEDPLTCLGAGRIPNLAELRLHAGTVWLWNRPIYDPAEGGHLRVEMRALPSGPTVVDMLANTAFLLGLTLGLAPEAEAWTGSLPFADASHNFYRAAQHGLAAVLRWPGEGGREASPGAARDVALRLLPLARQGLLAAGVEAEDADPLLAVLEGRLETGQTGAVWQERTLAALEPGLGRAAALGEMFRQYSVLSRAGEPVHRWPVGS